MLYCATAPTGRKHQQHFGKEIAISQPDILSNFFQFFNFNVQMSSPSCKIGCISLFAQGFRACDESTSEHRDSVGSPGGEPAAQEQLEAYKKKEDSERLA